ncbi:flagellar protein FlaG protein [Spirochaeta thermophila DSM 6578]|uniref:Flagellar protein FlaG protein n=1 Tax=Winmispira thermophila (strain ATCC 700085 / DSM 6578 / Z-1203) TaxID=869211 RepID=G0GFW5_WINT7|nr:flagellar protein FlaG [Spirochaeta thermophila]AEJ61658.1 flagellar protein FlaG protein [Spirochaeta thermophila DSM 6578]
MRIDGVWGGNQQQQDYDTHRQANDIRTAHETSGTARQTPRKETLSPPTRLPSLFNRRLKYMIDPEVHQVIVKVIDRETEKVIKELPPEALQRLHRRIREAVALLVDEQV